MVSDIAALRDRTSKLSAAVLRVTASLDESTVLQEIVDSACELTNARYGVITTIDDARAPRDFVTSGFTSEQYRQMESWLPDGLELFDHLRDLPAPLRLADLPSYIRSLGFSVDLIPAKTFQGTPMRHRGAHVGSFFLAGKRGGREFSDEDENVLLLFAAQAATAIANARTHRKEQRARASLEALERLRTEFLSMVSHELRAPLTSIKGSAATVLGASDDLDRSELLQFFRIVDDQADHMRGLIGDLLDVGRIESGTLSVAPQPVELTRLVERARSAFASGGARHAVSIDLPRDLPRVMADERRIVQVLNNLLSNAARHSPESSPIRVEAAPDGHHVAVTVADRGSGVPPHLLPHLFSKHAGVVGGKGSLGAGLGLAICKGLVEAHGGRISARSGGRGQGTRIVFTIPAAEEPVGGEASEALAADGSEGPRSRGRPRVLVLDDDPQALRFARDALASRGYAPVVAGDARELPRLLRRERPDLVLLDLVLPGTDGIELLQRLPELADVPVIFISAYGRDETVARALEAGAEDYIAKPFSPTELTARVGVALRKRLSPGPFVLGALSIDRARRRVTVAGRRVKLTATEYELLRVLSLNAGHVTTYDALLRRVWGGREYAQPQLVRAFVKKLRTKLGDNSSDPTWIFNERGVGYRMPKPGEV